MTSPTATAGDLTSFGSDHTEGTYKLDTANKDRICRPSSTSSPPTDSATN
jgi:hypothetical protein